jgi:hypothetical protein
LGWAYIEAVLRHVGVRILVSVAMLLKHVLLSLIQPLLNACYFLSLQCIMLIRYLCLCEKFLGILVLTHKAIPSSN